MKILVFGSANIDRTYLVGHFVNIGETLSARSMKLFCGGKGFNQAIAFVRAGSDVYFAGAVGDDGGMLIDTLKENGVNVDHLKQAPGPSGHAVIQVTPEGQNSIIILPARQAQSHKSPTAHRNMPAAARDAPCHATRPPQKTAMPFHHFS